MVGSELNCTPGKRREKYEGEWADSVVPHQEHNKRF